jgi:hypothetical protein
MSTQVAQANFTGNGASNAADFQPPTGNPQNVPGQLFPGSPTLQTVTTQDVLQNRNTEILVPTSSSAGTQDVAVKHSNNWVAPFILFIVCAIVFAAVWRKRQA